MGKNFVYSEYKKTGQPMTITQLRYLVAVKNHGSFAKAAESCHIAQPTLSTQIKKLEQEIDVELFDRQSSPIKLTEAGQKYLEQAELVLAETIKLEAIFKQEGPLSGSIKIGIIPTIGTYLLPMIVRSLNSQYPEVDFFFQEVSTRQIISMLQKDELDLGIAATPIENNELQERPVYYEPFVLYSSEVPESKEAFDPRLLNDFPLLVLTSENCFSGQVLKICPRSSESKVECNSLETIIGLVDANVGITLIPEIYAHKSQVMNQKKISHLKKPVPAREVSFLYKASFIKNSILIAIEEEILKHIDPIYQTRKDKSILGVEDR